MVNELFCAPLVIWRLMVLVLAGRVTSETEAYDRELRERMEDPNDPWAAITRNGLKFTHFLNDRVQQLKLHWRLEKPNKWYPFTQKDANQMKNFAPWLLDKTEADVPEQATFFVVSRGHAVLVVVGHFGFTTPTVIDRPGV